MSDDLRELVRRTAALARLDVDDAEVERLAPQFERILAAFRALEALDDGEGEAMVRAGGVPGAARADELRPFAEPDELLARAPALEERFFRVPRTLGGDA